MNLIDPCTDKLTDEEFLIHMIPHHQVAIDMSKKLLETTRNPNLINMCHKIIRVQNYEIEQMNVLLKNDFNSLFKKSNNTFRNLKFKTNIKNDKNYCDPLFFKPEHHKMHMKHINDEIFLKHMIPHHQVAIDMSKRLLLYTNHSYLIHFCFTLIYEQEIEISIMKDLLKSCCLYKSVIIK